MYRKSCLLRIRACKEKKNRTEESPLLCLAPKLQVRPARTVLFCRTWPPAAVLKLFLSSVLSAAFVCLWGAVLQETNTPQMLKLKDASLGLGYHWPRNIYFLKLFFHPDSSIASALKENTFKMERNTGNSAPSGRRSTQNRRIKKPTYFEIKVRTCITTSKVQSCTMEVCYNLFCVQLHIFCLIQFNSANLPYFWLPATFDLCKIAGLKPNHRISIGFILSYMLKMKSFISIPEQLPVVYVDVQLVLCYWNTFFKLNFQQLLASTILCTTPSSWY